MDTTGEPAEPGMASGRGGITRQAAIGLVVAFAGLAALAAGGTFVLTGFAVMGTDPCLPDSLCIAAFDRWLRALRWSVSGVVVACGAVAVAARTFRGKLLAVLALPLLTVLVWALFLTNSSFSDAGTV